MSGFGEATSSWRSFAREFAADGRHVCAYDRAGVGRSDDPAPGGPRTTIDQVDDAVSLLDAADLKQPVVLVAHSLGSLPAIALVARASERVAGLVLIDPWPPRMSAAQRSALPPPEPNESPRLAEERVFLSDFLFDPGQNAERLLLSECDAEVARLLDEPGPLFGDLPVTVLKAPMPGHAGR
jgi:pimeloyl-ACP methyl ester carboxylesterase